MGNTVRFLDTHVHHWDPSRTPREASPLVRLLGFSPRLLNWAAKRVFPKEALDFYGSPEFIVRPYYPEDYVADLADAVDSIGYIHVEAGWVAKSALAPVDETRWIDALASANDIGIVGIVANTDLTLGEQAAEVLEAHLAASHRVRGIRDMLAWHPNPTIMNATPIAERSRRADFRRGFELLTQYNLSYETSIYSNQLDELRELALAFPEQPILVCHMGTPIAIGGQVGEVGRTENERLRIHAEWAEGIIRLAECPNVWMKLSGLLMPACGFGFERRSTPPSAAALVDTIGPLIDHVIDTFGAERCMFGSNFPVDKPSVPLATLIQAYRIIAEKRSAEEQAQLFAGSAQAFYRLTSQG